MIHICTYWLWSQPTKKPNIIKYLDFYLKRSFVNHVAIFWVLLDPLNFYYFVIANFQRLSLFVASTWFMNDP